MDSQILGYAGLLLLLGLFIYGCYLKHKKNIARIKKDVERDRKNIQASMSNEELFMQEVMFTEQPNIEPINYAYDVPATLPPAEVFPDVPESAPERVKVKTRAKAGKKSKKNKVKRKSSKAPAA